jgi:hypothetical protein
VGGGRDQRVVARVLTQRASARSRPGAGSRGVFLRRGTHMIALSYGYPRRLTPLAIRLSVGATLRLVLPVDDGGWYPRSRDGRSGLEGRLSRCVRSGHPLLGMWE